MRTAAERGWKLHDYQELARDYLRARDRAGLFLDMGLGKTASSLSALEERHLPVLVVAPKRVAESVWPHETRLWRPELKVAVAKGQPARRAEALRDSRADIVVIGWDNIRDALRVKRDRPYRTLILDELSGYKNRGTARWKAAKRIIASNGIQHVWGLTGTPSPNGMMNLWSQIYLLDEGKRLGRTLTSFRAQWFTPGRRLPNGIITEWNIREGAEDEILARLEDLCLSMKTDGRIHVPPVTENHIDVELPQQVKRIYRDLKRDMVVNLDILGGEIHTAKNAAVLSSKLSQVSAGFLFVDDADIRGRQYQKLHNAKTLALQEIVESDHEGGVLVFYRFRPEAELIREQLGDLVYGIDEPGVIEAWNRQQVPVLLAHPASAGHGLNLQHGGHTIAWTSLDWDLELWQQANKRLARQGQKNPVVIHVIDAAGIDHLVRASLDNKDIIQGRLLDHLESPL